MSFGVWRDWGDSAKRKDKYRALRERLPRSIRLEMLDPFPGLVDGIPESWRSALALEGRARIDAVLELWTSVVPEEMRKTIAFLESRLRNVDLVRLDDDYQLAYWVVDGSDKMRCCLGGNPLSGFGPNERLKGDWPGVPEALRRFYEELHNGLFDSPSRTLGLEELPLVIRLADLEWGIIEDLSEGVKIDLDRSYGFFVNGGGGYGVIDLSDCDNDKATVWWATEKPTYDVRFWDVVDEWFLIGLGAG